MTDDFPRRRAATRGFRLGAPRNVHVAANGDSVLFLRSGGPRDPVNSLWRATWPEGLLVEELLVDAGQLLAGADETLPAAERAKRERLREVGNGITAFSVTDNDAQVAFGLSGGAFVHDVATGATRRIIDATTLANVSIDPTGRWLAATDEGALVVAHVAAGAVRRLREPGHPAQSWGTAEFVAAEELDRTAGYWWAPDGTALLVAEVDESDVTTWFVADPANPATLPMPIRYPAAGTANAAVRLHLIRLDGSGVAVAWDNATHEYLTAAHWSRHGLVIAALDRAQTELVTMLVDPATGATRELTTESSDTWVDLVTGVPRMTPWGLLSHGVDETADAHRLYLIEDGVRTPITPPDLQVQSVAAGTDDEILFTAIGPDPADSTFWRWRPGGTPVGVATLVSDPHGWAVGTGAGGTLALSRADQHSVAAILSVRPRDTEREYVLPSSAELPGIHPDLEFVVDEGWSRIAVLWPQNDSLQADTPPLRLPIIMAPYGGPHAQRSLRAAGAFLTEQWFANQGFCVVVADGPGSPSRPSLERRIHRDLATGPLQGQIEALANVVAQYPNRVDPTRVAIMGWSFGGYLAALAVLERPDLFHAAIAGAPVTEWRLYDTAYTERYLGMPDGEQGAYDPSSLIPRADRLERPLLLIHGTNDDNVHFAHALQLSGALLAAGKEHDFLPLSGVTHMAHQEVIAENLLLRQLDFLRRHLHTPVLG